MVERPNGWPACFQSALSSWARFPCHSSWMIDCCCCPGGRGGGGRRLETNAPVVPSRVVVAGRRRDEHRSGTKLKFRSALLECKSYRLPRAFCHFELSGVYVERVGRKFP